VKGQAIMDTMLPVAAGGVLSAPPRMMDLGASEVAYWTVGHGPPLVLVHGYPVSGRTWRHVVARLADRFTCVVMDMPGTGETRWSARTAFGFADHAQTVLELIDRLGLRDYALMGHDTGGTIARRIATLDAARVRRLVLIGTEIPHHRPPWIELFQRTSNPARPALTQFLLARRWFRQSSAGLGGCFYDRSLIEGEFKSLFLDPVIASRTRASGLSHYLRGIDWAMVDGMAAEHARITMPTLLIWGEDDPIFPPARARVIADQLPDCRGFVTVPRTKLFVHEEAPDAVARLAGEFFGS
jgi:pimeloyl-ACP methyl ester carboxylesterase